MSIDLNSLYKWLSYCRCVSYGQK